MKVGAVMEFDALKGRELVVLCEAGLTTSQDVSESHWSWAIPLVEVSWRWEHIIGISDDEAD